MDSSLTTYSCTNLDATGGWGDRSYKLGVCALGSPRVPCRLPPAVSCFSGTAGT